MTSPLGFSGDRLTLITTAETAARLGYPSLDAWYADAKKRRASNFPRPTRRGLYQLGRLQDWMEAGGFEQAWAHAPGAASGADGTTPAAEPPQGRPPARSEPSSPRRSEDTGENVLTFSPRQEVLDRLRQAGGSR